MFLQAVLSKQIHPIILHLNNFLSLTLLIIFSFYFPLYFLISRQAKIPDKPVQCNLSFI